VSAIFFSWASPDATVAQLILDRLRDAGLSVSEYTEDMVTGDDIAEWVANKIEEARIFVGCVSQAALEHSGWVAAEIGAASARYVRKVNPLERMMIIRIGDPPDGWQSPLVPKSKIRYFNITDRTNADALEAQVEELVSDLHEALGTSAPLVIPAALFAMTAAEFADLPQYVDQNRLDRLVLLCRGVGMPPMPVLWDELSKRHGATDRDFTPYAEDRTLIQLAEAVVRSVNVRRRGSGKRPIHLRWCSRAELSQDDAIRDRWIKERRCCSSILFRPSTRR
jgi:hypothetical protein